ncbi:MAG TPA: UvrB/UvrC motif-containing protein [Candidatus Paceibacterota bacterium]|nr:UvrB/UvrC motif-containing protein [Candidatus Paceibacterota bacterium]
MKAADYKTLPDTPGVYIMKDAAGRVLYVGKAANLRRRVSSYFERPHDVRIETLVSKITRIDHESTDTALEALIREAELIRTLAPPFNVKEKDDKSFLYAEITREKFPRVVLVRGQDAVSGKRYGPFTSASGARQALKILRKIFPWSTHDPDRIGKFARPCFDHEIGLCPGTCIGAVTREDYLKNIGRLKLFFEGGKRKIIRDVEREMKAAARALDFEKAAGLRRQLFALRHIRDTALIADAGDGPVMPGPAAPYRIEGYDISNISGTSAVGSMVVFEDGEPDKSGYRKFRIRTVFQPNDVGMLTEVLERRFRHGAAAGGSGWRLPNLILIDGGIAQANAAKKVLMKKGLKIPILGIAKGPERKRNDILGAIPKGVAKETLVRVRDEAHRFAIGYHKALRRINSLS